MGPIYSSSQTKDLKSCYLQLPYMTFTAFKGMCEIKPGSLLLVYMDKALNRIATTYLCVV